MQTQTVDFVLAGLLLLGRLSAHKSAHALAPNWGEQLRGLLALIVLMVSLKLGFDLVITPEDVFSVEILK